jgi:hypothetical protein
MAWAFCPFSSGGIQLDFLPANVLRFCRAFKDAVMDWIGEIEKHAGGLGRPTIFKEAMTTLSFRLEEGLKEDLNLLAEYLARFWCKLLKGLVSCDKCRDDGTDLGTRSVQGTAF